MTKEDDEGDLVRWRTRQVLGGYYDPLMNQNALQSQAALNQSNIANGAQWQALMNYGMQNALAAPREPERTWEELMKLGRFDEALVSIQKERLLFAARNRKPWRERCVIWWLRKLEWVLIVITNRH